MLHYYSQTSSCTAAVALTDLPQTRQRFLQLRCALDVLSYKLDRGCNPTSPKSLVRYAHGHTHRHSSMLSQPHDPYHVFKTIIASMGAVWCTADVAARATPTSHTSTFHSAPEYRLPGTTFSSHLALRYLGASHMEVLAENVCSTLSRRRILVEFHGRNPVSSHGVEAMCTPAA